jgi:hypothetical protein
MRRPDLVPDCGSCDAICCVATTFDASDDFAFDKPAGVACRHLGRDHRCTIHDDLAGRGFLGCAAFDCFGAGPRMTRAFPHAAGEDPERRRNEAFLVLRAVHELLWLLTEAAKLCPRRESDLWLDLCREIEALDAIASGPMTALSELDVRPRDRAARALLRRLGHALGGRRDVVRLRLAVVAGVPPKPDTGPPFRNVAETPRSSNCR